ncbi:MAG: malate dehydrogenase, partial [Candidatus Omnitrophota bacterium]
VVTNPLDIMTYVAYKISGLDSTKVIGMAGVLDSSRMNLLASRILNKTLADVNSLVLGTHGQTMAPAISNSTLNNKPIYESADTDQVHDIIENTKARGAEIVSFLGTGSAFYAPSAGVFKMVKAIVEDTDEILPCSCFLDGEYGFKDIYLGVPVKLGKGGLKEIVELAINAEEKDLLKKAAESVKQTIESLEISTGK